MLALLFIFSYLETIPTYASYRLALILTFCNSYLIDMFCRGIFSMVRHLGL